MLKVPQNLKSENEYLTLTAKMIGTTLSQLLWFLTWILEISVSGSTTGGGRKPPIVSHLSEAAIRDALTVARERHDRSIQKALATYDTDSVSGQVDPAVNQTTFRKYPIQAPGSLPDFGDELERAIYVTDPPLLSASECATIIQNAEDFVGNNAPWGLLPSGQYHISGFWIKDAPASIREWFNKLARQRLFPLFQRLYPDFVQDPADLCIDSAYLFKYTAETGRRTEVHTDCGCLSFTIALNDGYEGGGTFFEGLQDNNNSQVLQMRQGQITMRPGGVKHAGCAIESGVRYIIGGFCMNRKKVEAVRMLLNQDADISERRQQALFEAAIFLNPTSDIPYNLLANGYLKLGDRQDAKKVLECGLEYAHPGSSELSYSLSTLLMEEHDYKKAIEGFKICLEMDDCDIDALFSMGTAYAALCDSDHERQCYERIIRAPAAAPKRMADAYCNLGVLNAGTDAEIDFYRKSLEYLPRNFDAQYSLGAAYATRQQWSAAVEAFRASVLYANEEESEILALRSLYQATKHLVSSRLPVTSHEAALRHFQEVMGIENFQKLREVTDSQSGI